MTKPLFLPLPALGKLVNINIFLTSLHSPQNATIQQKQFQKEINCLFLCLNSNPWVCWCEYSSSAYRFRADWKACGDAKLHQRCATWRSANLKCKLMCCTSRILVHARIRHKDSLRFFHSYIESAHLGEKKKSWCAGF